MNEPANHPRTCRVCHGTGYQTTTCTHHWSNDDPHIHEPIPFEKGIQIAWRAYLDECRKLGREPNRERFERWLT